MRVLFLENSKYHTGAFYAALEIGHLLRHDHHVDFLLPADSCLGEEVKESGFCLFYLPMLEIGRSFKRILWYLPKLLLNTFRLRKILKSRNSNVLIVNDYYNLLGFTVRATGWRGEIVTFVRLMPNNQNSFFNRVWIICAQLASNKVVAVSRAVAGQLPLHPKICTFQYCAPLPESLPSSLRLGNDLEVLYLYPANYIVGKGHQDCLDAFSRAYQVNSNIRLRFVGSDMGLAKNRDFRENLCLQVLQRGLKEVVAVDDFSCDKERLFKGVDVVLNFSRSESFSRTCFEASYFGVPVIATRCGGPEEIIDDEVTGLLVEVGDLDAMRDAILRLADDGRLRRSMGAAGRVSVRRKFVEQRINFLSKHKS